MTGSRYIEASIAARVVVAILIAIAIAGIVLLNQLVESWTPAREATTLQLEEVARKINSMFLVLIWLSAAIAALLSGSFVWIGINALRSNEYPPAGTIVLRRTRIKQGKTARVPAYLSLMMALVVWMPVGILVYVHDGIVGGT